MLIIFNTLEDLMAEIEMVFKGLSKMSSLIRLVLYHQHLQGHNRILQMYSVKDILDILQPSIQLCPSIPSMSIHLHPPHTNPQS